MAQKITECKTVYSCCGKYLCAKEKGVEIICPACKKKLTVSAKVPKILFAENK